MYKISYEEFTKIKSPFRLSFSENLALPESSNELEDCFQEKYYFIG